MRRRDFCWQPLGMLIAHGCAIQRTAPVLVIGNASWQYLPETPVRDASASEGAPDILNSETTSLKTQICADDQHFGISRQARRWHNARLLLHRRPWTANSRSEPSDPQSTCEIDPRMRSLAEASMSATLLRTVGRTLMMESIS